MIVLVLKTVSYNKKRLKGFTLAITKLRKIREIIFMGLIQKLVFKKKYLMEI